MTWRSVVRSAIGVSHQQQQLPCQDYGGDRVLGDILVGAVADGAGSARHSDIGAQLAVETAVQFLAWTEEWLQKRGRSWLNLPTTIPTQTVIDRLFIRTVAKVRSTLQTTASANGYTTDDLACTLLAFVATPAWVAAMQIGDGFMVVRSPNQDYHLLFQPDKGEFANQTTFVTSTNALEDLQIRVLAGKYEFICAATDALEKVAIRLHDWTPFPPFFQPLAEYLDETPDPNQDDAYLVSFLESDRLNARTDDDKTLLLGLYQ